jgi:hypothetical protein
MNMKTTIALILGLVFQLSLVMPGIGAVVDCAPATESCECCAGMDSCPCADEGEPLQNPLPVAPESGNSLKVPVAKVSSTRVSVETLADIGPSVSAVSSPMSGPLSGYTGVRLSVAFCTFVI